MIHIFFHFTWLQVSGLCFGILDWRTREGICYDELLARWEIEKSDLIRRSRNLRFLGEQVACILSQCGIGAQASTGGNGHRPM